MTSSELPPRVVQSRRTGRKRALLTGRIASRDGLFVFECTLRNLSAEGAQIVLKPAQYPPAHMFLVYSRTPHAFEAELTWTKAPHFGVKFLRTLELSELPPELSPLVAFHR